MKKTVTFLVNDKTCTIEVGPYESLNRVLREHLAFTGTKRGCDYGGCGSCTVLLEGRAVYSCMVPAMRLAGKRVQTIEGIGEPGGLHPLQKSFLRNTASQCGFSTPGMIMSAVALLKEVPDPTEDQIKQAISGNLCRCTGYVSIVKAISEASKEIASTKGM